MILFFIYPSLLFHLVTDKHLTTKILRTLLFSFQNSTVDETNMQTFSTKNCFHTKFFHYSISKILLISTKLKFLFFKEGYPLPSIQPNKTILKIKTNKLNNKLKIKWFIKTLSHTNENTEKQKVTKWNKGSMKIWKVKVLKFSLSQTSNRFKNTIYQKLFNFEKILKHFGELKNLNTDT